MEYSNVIFNNCIKCGNRWQQHKKSEIMSVFFSCSSHNFNQDSNFEKKNIFGGKCPVEFWRFFVAADSRKAKRLNAQNCNCFNQPLCLIDKHGLWWEDSTTELFGSSVLVLNKIFTFIWSLHEECESSSICIYYSARMGRICQAWRKLFANLVHVKFAV